MTHDETTETNATDFFELPDDEAPSKPPPRRQTGKHSTPRKALPLILLQDALTGAELRRVREARSLLLLVKVPSPAWVESVRDALRALGSWHEIEVRDGSTRYRRKPEDVGEVAVRIGDGLRVAAVCHDPAALLPPSLIACADISVALGPPSDRVIRRAIKAVTGTMPRRVPHRAGLDFADLVGCIRVGDTAAAAVRRLSEASQARLGTLLALWSEPDPAGLPIIDTESGSVAGRMAEPGYAIIPALAACAVAGAPLPAGLQDPAADENYYPATLHLLALTAANMRYRPCLGR